MQTSNSSFPSRNMAVLKTSFRDHFWREIQNFEMLKVKSSIFTAILSFLFDLHPYSPFSTSKRRFCTNRGETIFRREIQTKKSEKRCPGTVFHTYITLELSQKCKKDAKRTLHAEGIDPVTLCTLTKRLTTRSRGHPKFRVEKILQGTFSQPSLNRFG